MICRIALLLFIALLQYPVSGQKLDSLMVRRIFDEALVRGQSYENLRVLCKEVGPRLTGSPGGKRGEQWAFQTMQALGFENVRLQAFQAPYWIRGEAASFVLDNDRALNICALGGSIGTDGPLTAEVLEVPSSDHLEKLDSADIAGKIVFINKPMNPKLINTFAAYGACAGERWGGASKAARFGAVGVLVRSMTLSADDYPHTGSMGYNDTLPKIPAAAISTNDAHFLSNLLEKGPVRGTLEMFCENRGETTAHNVMGEIRGKTHPDQVIVVSGHLDSWDLGEGAHDDGAGVVQSIEVLRLFQALEYTPNYTIRCVLYMNEENGARGGAKYAEEVKKTGEVHLAAFESDRGGFAPRGFSIDARAEQLEYLRTFKSLLEPFYLHLLEPGYSGVDIGFLKNGSTALVGFVPDTQRYFDVHHTANDVFEEVHKRELELGSASIAALVYLVDRYGLPEELKK